MERAGPEADLVFQIYNPYAANSAFLTVTSVIADNGSSMGVTKSGPGLLYLNAVNTYTGVTTINGGLLNIASNVAANTAGTIGNASASAANLMINGGTLFDNTSAVLSFGRLFSIGLNGATLQSDNATATNTWTFNGNYNGSTAVGLVGLGSRTLTLQGANTGANTFGLSLGDNGGPTSLVKAGAGMWVLNAGNTYTGTTTITQGELRLGSAIALPGGLGALGSANLTAANTGGGNLIFNATAGTSAILQLTAASGGFYRAVGTGIDQVSWAGSGGFSANGADQVVNLGGQTTPATLVWNSTPGFVTTGNNLVLGSTNATNTITFQNALDLNGATRTVQVDNGATAIEGILSGAISSTGTGILNKTGAGTLELTGANNTSSTLSATVSAGYLVFGSVSAIPGAAGATVTVNSGGGVVLAGAADPSALLARLATGSTGALLIDAASTSAANPSQANLNLSALPGLTLGAFSNPAGTPAYFAGAITPAGNTYRFADATQAAPTTALGSSATAIQAAFNILVLPSAQTLNGNNAVSVGTGVLLITNANSYTGGTTVTTTGALDTTALGVGNNSALGTGALTFAGILQSDFTVINGDHLLSNNFRLSQSAGNLVLSSNLGSSGTPNVGMLTIAGTFDATGFTSGGSIYSRGAPVIFLGDFKDASSFTLNQTAAATFSMLVTPPGAVAKSFTGAVTVATSVTLVIDSDRSLGAVPASAFNDLTISGTLEVQPGTVSPVSLTSKRNIAITGNAAPTFNVPGGPVVGSNSTLVIPGVISGGGTGLFAKTGLGTLTLQGQNTFTATASNGIQILGGTLLLDYANSLATTNMITSGTTITLGTSTNGTFSNGGTLSVTANANNVAQTFGTLQFTAKNSTVVLTDNSATSSLAVSFGLITRTAIGGVVDFRPTTAGGTITINSTQAGSNGILLGTTWNGADLVAASGTTLSKYTGYTALTGSASAPSITPGATANVRIDNSTSNTVTLAASGTTDIYTLTAGDPTSRTIDIGSGNILRLGAVGMIVAGANTGGLTIGATPTGSLTAGGAANTAGELVFINNSSNSLTVNSAIANNGAGAVTLTKSGSGTLTLGSANTFTGAIYLDSGVLEYSDGSATGKSLGSGSSILMNGGTLRYTGSTSNNLIFAATFNTYSGLDVANAAGLVNQTGGMTGIAGVAGILQKSGAGALTLGGTTDNANLSVEATAGIVNLNKTSSASVHAVSAGSAAAALIIDNGAIINITGTGGDQINDVSSVVVKTNGLLNLNGNTEAFDGLSGGGSVTGTAGSVLTLGGSAASNNLANISANSLAAANAGMASVGLNNFSGSIDGNISLVKNGAGTQILGGSSSYTGTTTINAGTLLLATTNALPTNTTVNIAGATVIAGLVVPGTLDLGGFSQAIDALNSTTGGIVTNTPGLTASGSTWSASAVTSTLTIGSNDGSGSFNGVLQDGYTVIPGTTPTGVTGALALVKTGAGTQVLAGLNTYSGNTTINGGVLIVSGTNLSTGTVTITGTNSATSTLIVTGAVGTSGSKAGSVTVNNGGLLAGTGAISSSTALVVNNGGAIRGGYAAGGNNYGTLAVNNDVTINSTSPTAGGSILTELVRNPAPAAPLGSNNFYIGGTSDIAGQNSLLNVAGTFKLNPIGGLIAINLLDSTGSLSVGENYTINLVQATAFQLNGTPLAAGTVIDSGSGPGSGTMGVANVTLTGNSGYAAALNGWTLQTDPTGQMLQLSLSTPEPHHLLLICSLVLAVMLAVRRWRGRAGRVSHVR